MFAGPNIYPIAEKRLPGFHSVPGTNNKINGKWVQTAIIPSLNNSGFYILSDMAPTLIQKVALQFSMGIEAFKIPNNFIGS